MLDLSNLVNRQLMLFVLIAIGFLFGKLGYLEEKARRFLSELVVKLLMPCNLLTVLMVEAISDTQLRNFLLAMAAGFLFEGLYFLLSKPLARPCLQEEKTPFRYAVTSPNAAFMGIPIITGIYGSEGMLYLAALLIPVNVFMYFFGLRLYLPKEGPRPSLVTQLLHPAMIAVVIGFTMLATGLRPPLFLRETIVSLGACTTPISMVLIGGILATVELKTIFSRSNFYYCGLRLLILPLITLVAVVLLRLPPMVAGVLVLIMGMPAAVSTAALATTYNNNAAFASKMIFLSTVLSLLTLPVLAVLLQVVVPL